MEMQTVKTSDAAGPVLEWLVAKCEIPNDVRDNRPRFWIHRNNPKLICRQTYNHETNPKGYELCCYSTDLSQGEEIIKRENIYLQGGKAFIPGERAGEYRFLSEGPTPLIAAMRCYVTSKLGSEVQVPVVLLKLNRPDPAGVRNG